jgi:hypothetical protein
METVIERLQACFSESGLSKENPGRGVTDKEEVHRTNPH